MNASATVLAQQPVATAEASVARRSAQPLPSPAVLRQRLPLNDALAARIHNDRNAIRAVLDSRDPRLLVVVGPCSLHDPVAALEYAERLSALAPDVSDQLLLVMRAYVEKPRTTVGWKGLVYDPHLDGSGNMAEGLHLSRRLMLDILETGLPIATELLQPLAAGYFDDLLGWAAIGARTSESQIHRELVSGLDLPVGFKNGTDGGLGIACDAMRSAEHPHQHFGIDDLGHPALLQTRGNPDTHLVLRGGHGAPNYDAASVAAARRALEKQGIASRIMVDCSHANSGKDPLRQPAVLESVTEQRLAGDMSLRGVMLESHLFDGCQPLSGELRYGVSITDGCLGWTATEQMLRLAAQRLRG
ncbi:MAG TPA: 3-deoxy-7-phosphoheptulonate synthase [Pseudomonas sp.]|uniref:3-deoxy-7-phosphoheptulonate synthase n=1 Tax=Stutzerimonas frequens TaxID=2968969 RepID=UPI000C550EED|nr:3-deoxy-7-phosphoheptulonate synthase [Stutzerimonas frequens]MAL93415.1 3-deoxy-7-phosphoheptulonate synthase [Pseudomonas sp.]QFU11634.1 Phospho-2-dehydro-3-deoxyheptonate aldolase, Tyr-sensitive [Stutzerimonas frequens]HAW62030.1 3-deoxy-7-phosphoheptulonate synthase [Pseudomonas sp.]|tara:strand:- start:4245 stop:5321 length:1077 start_codon:yes stop_codon:yes gene_type:complete